MNHIVFLLPELIMGGAQRVMLLLAREFVKRGHKVDLVLLQEKGELLGSIPSGVRAVPLLNGNCNSRFQSLLFVPVALFRLIVWLRRERPNVLLSTITGTNLLAVVARWLSRVPIRLVLREAVSLDNVQTFFRLIAMRVLYPRADAVIALNCAMIEQLQHRLRIPAERLCCISNPVDSVTLCRLSLESVNHPWLLRGGVATIITVGRLIPQKDHSTLIRALSLLPETLSCQLIIVGDGPDRLKLEKLVRSLDLVERVLFVGVDENPWRWMVRSHLFVLSSKWEGCPNAMLEAIYLGLPIISTQYDKSVYEILRIGSDSLNRVVEVGHPHLLADAISDVIKKGGVRLPEVSEGANTQKRISSYETVLTQCNNVSLRNFT